MIDNDLTVSVCIPTYGKKPNLDKLLKSLERQSDTNFEILIIHNYQEKIKHDFPKKNSLPINYTFTEEIGVSNARNLGISLSNTDLIFFIDDDEIPDTKWVEFLKKPFQRDNSLVGLGGVVKSTQNKNVLKKDSYISSLLSEKYVETYRSSEDSIASKKNIEIFGGNFGLRLNAIKKYNFKFKPYLGRIKDILLSGEESQFFKEIRNLSAIFV